MSADLLREAIKEIRRDAPYLPAEGTRWHPVVALAVAAMLEAEIPNAEYREQQQHRANETRLPTTKPFPPYYDKTTAAAIAFARQYLAPEVA